MESPVILFKLFGLPVTGHVIATWVIMAVLLVLCTVIAKGLKMVPGRLQSLAEYSLEGMLRYYSGTLGPERGREYFPFLMTFFLLILFSNWSGIFPGAGHVSFYKPATSTWSVTAAFAIVVFVVVQVEGIRKKKLKYFKHFFEPFFFMFPLNLIEEFIKPLSLSLRLFGNIFGEEKVTAVLLGLVPYFVPVVMQLLGIFFGFIQALIFTTLAAVYLDLATGEHH